MTEMRKFTTGATRDTDVGKNDYEGFLSPAVLERFGNYMSKHRVQADGTLRDSDNWQKGIPKTAYIKSMWRHFMDVWFIHRGYKRYDKQRKEDITMDEALCALLFNVMGYLHETLKENEQQTYPEPFIKNGICKKPEDVMCNFEKVCDCCAFFYPNENEEKK